MFENKTCIITGGASGLGKAIAVQLLKLNARVYIIDINKEKISKLHQQYSSITTFNFDVTDKEAMINMTDNILNKTGRIDYLFNCAGKATYKELHKISLKASEEVIQTNLLGVTHSSMAVYKKMVSQKSGHIINISSITGLMPLGINITPYTASKHGVVGFSKALFKEAKSHNVKVSLVCPGYIDTPMLKKSPKNKKSLLSSCLGLPHNQPIKPEKAAQKILRGIKKDKFLIIFPNYMKIKWWFFKFYSLFK